MGTHREMLRFFNMPSKKNQLHTLIHYIAMRLISLSPAVTEILFALGKGHLIVARDQFSDYPAEAKAVPALRGHQSVNIQAIQSHKPDLVFTSTIIQEKLAAEIRSASMQCVHQDPRKLNDIPQTFLELGTILDCEQEARSLSETFRQGMNTVKKRAQSLPRHPRVYIEEWPALLGSSGKHSLPMVSGNWVPEVLGIAGGEGFPLGSVTLRRAQHDTLLSREVTLEEIKAFNPELIVLSICGAGSLAEKTLITARPGWEELPAVREGKVRIVDDSLLNRPGPRLVEGAQRLYGWIFEMLH
jgi:iron complex transport system substrate-binding protein